MPRGTAGWPPWPTSRARGRRRRAREERALRYLRDNLKYGLGEREIAGLRRFHELAAESRARPRPATV